MTGDRGQTGFDFFIGMSVFLLAVGFVFGFAPTMFTPFTTDVGSGMIVADRSAASLSGNVLVEDPATPGVLNASCTSAFFDTGSSDGCRFEHDGSELHRALGVDSSINVNATIEDDVVLYSAGPAPDPVAGVTVSRRIVFLDGEERTLFVRVW